MSNSVSEARTDRALTTLARLLYEIAGNNTAPASDTQAAQEQPRSEERQASKRKSDAIVRSIRAPPDAKP